MIKQKKEENKFDLISKDKLSIKLNEDLSELIKEELRKKIKDEHYYNNIKNRVIKLIIYILNQLNFLIYNNIKDYTEYTYLKEVKTKTLDENSLKIIYDIIILVLKHYPNKVFELKKIKFSKVNKYFIYKIYINSKYKNRITTKYILIDYNQYEDIRTIYILLEDTLQDLKTKHKIFDSLTNEEKTLSLSYNSSKSSKSI